MLFLSSLKEKQLAIICPKEFMDTYPERSIFIGVSMNRMNPGMESKVGLVGTFVLDHDPILECDNTGENSLW